MRQWQVDPRILCRQHLLGEHRELHALAGAVRKGLTGMLTGLAVKECIQLKDLEERHHELVAEMMKRGYQHNSPWPSDLHLPDLGQVNTAKSLDILLGRCVRCKARYEALKRSTETNDAPISMTQPTEMTSDGR
jgi:hypothetical protein